MMKLFHVQQKGTLCLSQLIKNFRKTENGTLFFDGEMAARKSRFKIGIDVMCLTNRITDRIQFDVLTICQSKTVDFMTILK